MLDLDTGRIAEMDAAGIDVQVLSLNSPGVEQLPAPEAIALAREANDCIAAAVKHHSTRFAGFAAVPLADPQKASDELERTVREYGFKGALINGHHGGRYLDDPFFSPLLERAVGLGVPVYLHPTPPLSVSSMHCMPVLRGRLPSYSPGRVGDGTSKLPFTVLRIILGGVFDRIPNLQLIVGHMGETLPFMMSRVDMMTPEVTRLQYPVSHYLRNHVHYTFAGFNFAPTFLDLLLQVGSGRIMFSADYPYGSMAEARGFLEKLPVSPADRERIAHGDAERLLGL